MASMEERKISAVAHAIVTQGLMSADGCTAGNIIDMSMFKDRCTSLMHGFANERVDILHAYACKTNPLLPILETVRKLGMGCECASYGEVMLAKRAGFEPRQIVYDSPCKHAAYQLTGRDLMCGLPPIRIQPAEDLRAAVKDGIYINLDNYFEVAEVDRILLGATSGPQKPDRQFGLRINPCLGVSSEGYRETTTATADSKFGVAVPDVSGVEFEELVATCQQHPWLQGLHVHVGSQGCALQTLVEGCERLVLLAEAINARLGTDQIAVLDIGGGMPTSYDTDTDKHSYSEYFTAVKRAVPGLFSGRFSIITEFGRSLATKCGSTLSLVKTVKPSGSGRPVVLIHVGANQFIREAYLPEHWKHRLLVLDAAGTVKHWSAETDVTEQDIAGPLCFSGDYLAKKRRLPPVCAGDIIAILDTGGYTLSMYSLYNSLRLPPTYAYEYSDSTGTVTRLQVIHKPKGYEDIISFWT